MMKRLDEWMSTNAFPALVLVAVAAFGLGIGRTFAEELIFRWTSSSFADFRFALSRDPVALRCYLLALCIASLVAVFKIFRLDDFIFRLFRTLRYEVNVVHVLAFGLTGGVLLGAATFLIPPGVTTACGAFLAGELILFLYFVSVELVDLMTAPKSIGRYVADGDIMSRHQAAELVQTIMESCKTDPGRVVLVTGGYGSGKSFLLDAFRQLMADMKFSERRFVVLPRKDRAYTPWYFHGAEEQLHQLLNILVAEVQRMYVVPSLSGKVQRILELVSSFSSSHANRLIEKFKGADELPDAILSLREWVSRLDADLVILVDEVDRLEQAHIRRLLALVHLVKIDRVHVVVSCEDTQLELIDEYRSRAEMPVFIAQ